MLTNISDKTNESLILELSEGEDVGTIGGYCEDGFPIYYANNKIAHMLGYEDVEDLIAGIHGKVANTIHPDDMERVVKELNNGVFYEGMTYKVTYRMPKKDGTSLWTVDKGKVIRAEDGRLAILSICNDMTAFIDRHAELERLNRFSQSTLENMPGGYHRCAAEEGYPFLYISDRFCEMFGWTREEIKTKFDNKFINMLHPEDTDTTEKYVELLNQSSNENVVDAIYRMKGKNGYIWVSDATSLVTVGNEMFYQGTLTDITGFVAESQKQDKLLREQLLVFDSLARHFKNVYWVDLEKETAKILKLDADYVDVPGKMDHQEFSFKAVVGNWINAIVCPEDREKVSSAVTIENIKKVFETQEELVGNYRSLANGEIHYFQYSISKADRDGTKAIAGFQNIDKIIEEHAEADRIKREKEEAHQRELQKGEKQLKAALEQGEFKTEIISSIAAAYKEIVVLNCETRDYYVVSGQKGGYRTAGTKGSFEQLKEKMFRMNLADGHKADSDTRSFFDFDTLQERLEGRDITSLEVKSVSGRWYLASFIANKRNHDGHVVDVLFVIRDIAEQKEKEHEKDAALLEQLAIIDTLSKSFRNVFVANLSDGTARVIRLADSYKVRAIREVSEQVFSFDAVVRRWVRENVHPEDKQRVAETLNINNLKKIFSRQDALVGSYRSMEGDVQHHYQYDFRRIGDTDNIVAGFQIIDAIIEEHQAQEKAQRELEEAKLKEEKEHAEVISSLSTIYSTIFRADIDTHTYDILTSIPLMSEVAKPSGNFDDVKEKILGSFIEPESRDTMRTFLDFDTLADRLKDANTITDDYKAPTGQWMQARFIAKRRNEDNAVKEVLYVARDITEEKTKDLKQQEALKNALAAAQQANKAKSTFLSSMSHDIRTPMNAIIGFTALAQTHMDNQAQVQDYLAKISTSSTHLLSLINDILDMSRIESGTVKLDEKPVHLPDILHDLRTMIQGLVNAKNLNLYIDTQDVVNEDVISDKLRLNQVLLNIVSNAIKFTQPGGDIIIRLLEKPCSLKNYTSYELSVKDTGIGMSEAFLEHVFDTFSREQSATVSGIQGTGLGLAITKNIVEMMGGEIKAESAEGKGSTFTVTLNLRIANAPVKNEPIPDLLGARALVVDDDMNTCRSVSKMLRDIQMRPDWTVSGKEAIVRAQDAADMKDEYKVYIIDYLMPDMNGIETVRRIRKVISEEVPIIVLTAYDWSDFEYEAREAGVTAFVSKPIFMSELRSVLTQPTISEAIVKEEKKKGYDYSGKRILLVEDNELNREIATAILEETGMTIDSVDDGDVAVATIEAAPAGKYDLILMDIQMPKMDGYTATREIRTLSDNRKANIPIVAMTANAFEEDKQRAYKAGMNGHIIKPVSIEEIARVLDGIFVQK